MIKRYKHKGKNLKPRDDGEWVRYEDYLEHVDSVRCMCYDLRELRIKGLREGLIMQLHYEDNKEKWAGEPELITPIQGPFSKFEQEAMHRYSMDAVFHHRVQHTLHNLITFMTRAEATLNKQPEDNMADVLAGLISCQAISQETAEQLLENGFAARKEILDEMSEV